MGLSWSWLPNEMKSEVVASWHEGSQRFEGHALLRSISIREGNLFLRSTIKDKDTRAYKYMHTSVLYEHLQETEVVESRD